MTRALINPPSLHPTPGFSHISIATGSRLISFAGQTALDPHFDLIGEDDLHAQTIAAMANLKTAMDAAGVGWEHIVRRTIFTLHPTQFQLITEAIDEATGGAEHPPQTLVGVTSLALPGLLIEIEATAVID